MFTKFNIAAAMLLLSTVATLAQAADAPTVVEAQVNASWWSGLASQFFIGGATVVTAILTSISPSIYMWMKSRSKLTAVLVSQAMFDKLIAGINAQIIAEAEKLNVKVTGTVKTAPPAAKVKLQIVENAAPKIEAAFKETLEHFGKAPGSQAVKDMILGRVDSALAAKPVVVPAVMARS